MSSGPPPEFVQDAKAFRTICVDNYNRHRGQAVGNLSLPGNTEFDADFLRLVDGFLFSGIMLEVPVPPESKTLTFRLNFQFCGLLSYATEDQFVEFVWARFTALFLVKP